MKKYNAPKIEIIELEERPVLTGSGDWEVGTDDMD